MKKLLLFLFVSAGSLFADSSSFPPGGGAGCLLSNTPQTGYVLTGTGGTGCSWQTVGGASVDNNVIKGASYMVDSGLVNALSGTTTTTFPASYANGQHLLVNVGHTNTGAVTINVNSIGAKSVTTQSLASLPSGTLQAGGIYILAYDGTEFQLVGTAFSLNGLVTPVQTFVNDTNVTIVSASSTHTLTWAGTLATSRGGLGASFGSCNGVATFSAGVTTCSGTTGTLGSVVLSVGPTLTGTTTVSTLIPTLINAGGGNITLPSGAGFVATATNTIGIESTNKNIHVWSNAADAINLAIASTPTNNDCLKASVVSGNVLAADNGSPCATVTSVSFTGGVISVSTATTTPSLTVSGISGGILYFSGINTWASSAVLTANMPVIGGGAGTAPGVGTVTGNTTLFVSSIGAQTSTAIVKIDGSGNHIASGCTIDSSNNLLCPASLTSGNGTSLTGFWSIQGKTSGAQGMTVADIAGASSLYILPAPGSSSTFLQLGSSTTCPTLPAGAPSTCYTLSWASPAGSGTVASSSNGQLPVFTAATTVTGNANLTFAGAALTIGVVGSAQGTLIIAGSSSGVTTLAAQSSGGGIMTLQAGTDTLVARATTDTLTNKTINCANNTCTIPATNRIRAISFTLGDPNGSALSTSATDYLTVPFACTISAYNLAIDAADATFKVKFWKVATGTAIPTVSNSISTSGVGISSGTAVHSTTVTDFTTTAVSANDIIAMNMATANTIKYINGVIECDQ